MDANQIISIVIFLAVMTLIVTEKVHRTTAALAGAVLLFLTGVLTFDQGMSHIDFNTLGVLVGMMLFVTVAKQSGLFEYLAYKSAKLAKGDPWRIMVAFVLVTAVCSAFLDNVTTVLLIAPMTFTVCKILDESPIPYFMTQILASNVGGTATLIGDPPNIMIGSSANLTFADFANYDGLCCIIILFAFIVLFYFIYGRKMKATPEAMATIMELDEQSAIRDRSLLHKSVVMICLVVVGFMLHGQLGLESSEIALTAAAIMLLIGGQDIEEMILGVEWTTIGFFAGLFIVVGGMSETGVITMLANWIMDVTGQQEVLTMLVILWVSAIVSSILDNIPFTATMIPVLLTMESAGMDVMPFWWALSLGACLGGNGTIIGASANVVLSGISNREGYPMTFIGFLKVGMPLMIVSVIIATFYLMIRFVWLPF
ncbi:MAG: SLC13 family permease [Eggerthellaceae bacterium]|jgi:Na+/H+ antiporter NhaD/arsenite permease-like protein